MRPLILKTGSAIPELIGRRGDFEHYFAKVLGLSERQYDVLDARFALHLPQPAGVDAVIVTGSASAVHDHEPWSVQTGVFLKAVIAAGRPVLGVCYGHQLIADALGGRTGRNPNGREIGLVLVSVLEVDPLLEGLPPVFPAFATHQDAVLEAPPWTRVLAGNRNSPVQAMALGPRTRTVQFHPEFDADIMRSYLDARASVVDAELGPGTARRLREQVVDVDTGRIILSNFVRFCVTST